MSLYRKLMVSASAARVLKSSHCLHLTITGGPRGYAYGYGGGVSVVGVVGGVSVLGGVVRIFSFVCGGMERNLISCVSSFCIRESLCSTRSIFSVCSPFSPIFSVIMPSSLINLSRSFSCSFSTLMMKSSASSASSLDGFLFKFCCSPFVGVYVLIVVWLLNKRSVS